MPPPDVAFGVPVPGADPGVTGISGLGPGLDVLRRGALLGTGILERTGGQVGDIFAQGAQGAQGIQPFVAPGQQANQLQAAQSGALGPEAQAQAFAQFQESPGQQFLREQIIRGIEGNASATGGLGSGNVKQELVRQIAGITQQDFGAQFGRLGDVATRGLSGATSLGGLAAQRAASEGGIQAGLGQSAANTAFQASRDAAQAQFQAGRDIAGGISGTTSSLANLINQQGAGTTDILGTGATNINNLIQLAQQGDANAAEQLSTLLANLGSQSASSFAGQPIIPGATTNTLGQLGQIASGVGGVLSQQGGTPAPVTESQAAFVG